MNDRITINEAVTELLEAANAETVNKIFGRLKKACLGKHGEHKTNALVAVAWLLSIIVDEFSDDVAALIVMGLLHHNRQVLAEDRITC